MEPSHKSASIGEDGLSQPDSQFVFVTDHDRRFIRSRLMRDSWTKRNRRNSLRPSKNRILKAKSGRFPSQEAASSATGKFRAEEQPAFDPQLTAGQVNPASFVTSFGISTIESNQKDLSHQGLNNDGYNDNSDEDMELLQNDFEGSSDQNPDGPNETRSQIPKSQDVIPSFESANFDPFETCPVTVRPFEHALIHHWIYVFGTMMFGKPRSAIDPMAEVWIPEALSNEASFQGMLSYAAAHLAHLRGRESGVRGAIYKIKSIAVIQKLLNNDQTMLSDSTVAAILRQISIEDRFGSSEIASVHRAGLEKIMEKRGGRIRGNWGLELLLHWYLITSRPKFQLKNQSEQETPADFGKKGSKEVSTRSKPSSISDISAKVAKLFDFFQELRLLTTSETRRRGPGISLSSVGSGTKPADRLLYLFKNSPGASRGPTHDIVEETCRVAALFYVAAIKADSLRFETSDFELLMTNVSETQSTWEYSLEMLLWVLLKGNGPGLGNLETVQQVLSYMAVAKLLQKESWNVVKEMLIGFICDDSHKAVGKYEESIFVADLMRIRS